MKAKKQLLGFAAASLSLTAAFVAGGAPIPYYNLYAQQLGAGNGVMSMVTVVYFCGGAQTRDLFNAGLRRGGLPAVCRCEQRVAHAFGKIYAGLVLRAGFQHGCGVYY